MSQVDHQRTSTNTTKMTPLEARELISAIKGNLESLRLMLLQWHRRRGWEALGYPTWRDCAIAEFRQSQAYVYRLLQAAEVEENLVSDDVSTIVEIGTVPVNQLATLAKLPSDQQAVGLQMAEHLAQSEGRSRTAAHVSKAVQEIRGQGKSLGLHSRGDSTLPESDRIDKLTHTSPVDVDVRLGALNKFPLTRIENDFYPTGTRLTEILLENVDITGRIVEPCAGDGAIAKLLPNCISNDFYPNLEYDCDYKLDATIPETWEKWSEDGFDWVVTNPPFSSAPEIIPLAFEHARVGIAMLLRLSYFEPCKDRADWLEANSDHLRTLITFNPRPKFRSNSPGTDNVTVAWVVWRKDWSWGDLGVVSPFRFVYNWRS